LIIDRAALCTCAASAVKPGCANGQNYLFEFGTRLSINAAHCRVGNQPPKITLRKRMLAAVK
jgi:hypothetical protein